MFFSSYPCLDSGGQKFDRFAECFVIALPARKLGIVELLGMVINGLGVLRVTRLLRVLVNSSLRVRLKYELVSAIIEVIVTFLKAVW